MGKSKDLAYGHKALPDGDYQFCTICRRPIREATAWKSVTPWYHVQRR